MYQLDKIRLYRKPTPHKVIGLFFFFEKFIKHVKYIKHVSLCDSAKIYFTNNNSIRKIDSSLYSFILLLPRLPIKRTTINPYQSSAGQNYFFTYLNNL